MQVNSSISNNKPIVIFIHDNLDAIDALLELVYLFDSSKYVLLLQTYTFVHPSLKSSIKRQVNDPFLRLFKYDTFCVTMEIEHKRKDFELWI